MTIEINAKVRAIVRLKKTEIIADNEETTTIILNHFLPATNSSLASHASRYPTGKARISIPISNNIEKSRSLAYIKVYKLSFFSNIHE